MSGAIPPAGSGLSPIGNEQLPSFIPIRRAIPLAPQNSSISSGYSCSDCIRDTLGLVFRIFRICVVGLVRCLINCCLCCVPQRRQAVQPSRPPYTPEAQAVVDYIAFANRPEPMPSRAELHTAFRALSEQVRNYVSSEVLRVHRAPISEREDNPRQIDNYISQFRMEERKGEAPSELEFVNRAIAQFIQDYPAHPTVIEACQRLLVPSSRERQRSTR